MNMKESRTPSTACLHVHVSSRTLHMFSILKDECPIATVAIFLLSGSLSTEWSSREAGMVQASVNKEQLDKLRNTYCDAAQYLGVPRTSAERCFTKLAQYYAEPHRRYHTLAHLHQCMVEFADVVWHSQDPALIVMAIFYHDITYDVHRNDNEAKSALYWKFIARHVLEVKNEGFIAEVARLIELSGEHRTDPVTDPDAALFLDVDMSILGADAPEYDAYAAAVRQEYAHCSDDEWAFGRVAKFLDPTLCEDRIFLTDIFRKKYEENARANLMEERCRYQKNLPLA